MHSIYVLHITIYIDWLVLLDLAFHLQNGNSEATPAFFASPSLVLRYFLLYVESTKTVESLLD